MTETIALDHVTVRRHHRPLLDDISFTVGRGERVVIVGPNGAGKTTLLRILSGALLPTAGTVHLYGKRLDTYDPAELARKRAVLSQHTHLAFPFTVREIVAMGATKAVTPTDVDRALEAVDLAAFADRITTTLSGGEQQRAHLARVLVQTADNPDALILLDEPTSNLDLRHQLLLAEVITKCADRGRTIVTVLHDLNLAPSFGERLIVLKDAKLNAQGPVGEIVTDRMVNDVFGVSNSVHQIKNIPVPVLLPHTARIARTL